MTQVLTTPSDSTKVSTPHRHYGCGRMMLMYEDGHTALTIANEVRTSLAIVFKNLRYHGVAIRPPGRPFQNKSTVPWTAEAVALYQQGFTAAAIGRKIGRTRERVRQVLVRELGAAYHPSRRSHRCTDVCVAVQTTPQPFQYLALARTFGASYGQVKRAAQFHGIKALGNRHQCTSRCEAILAGLRDGKSARSVAIGLGMNSRFDSQLVDLKSYHPDWPWFDARTLGNNRRHQESRRSVPGSMPESRRTGPSAGSTR